MSHLDDNRNKFHESFTLVEDTMEFESHEEDGEFDESKRFEMDRNPETKSPSIKHISVREYENENVLREMDNDDQRRGCCFLFRGQQRRANSKSSLRSGQNSHRQKDHFSFREKRGDSLRDQDT